MSYPPFLRWAGSKRRLTKSLSSYLPKAYKTYYEPFLGSGALFWAIQPDQAVLSDTNHELVNTYLALKYNPADLFCTLKQHPNQKEHFMHVRNWDRQPNFYCRDAVERAGRFLYLNKAGFNGHWAENLKGQSTIGYGYREKLSDFSYSKLLAYSHRLQSARLVSGPFQTIEHCIQKDDFVYLDPPYLREDGRHTKRQYGGTGFLEELPKDLLSFCQRMDKKGVFWMLSYNQNSLIKTLFKHYNSESISAYHCIAANAQNRGMVNEVIIKNY